MRLRDAVWRVLDVLHHPDVVAVSTSVSVPGESIEALASDAAIDAWLDTYASDYVHAVGTCRMGTPGDPAAVVDPTCAVIGYEGLRVCDASVMPDIPRANTHLTTVAIAEGIATRITADRQVRARARIDVGAARRNGYRRGEPPRWGRDRPATNFDRRSRSLPAVGQIHFRCLATPMVKGATRTITATTIQKTIA